LGEISIERPEVGIYLITMVGSITRSEFTSARESRLAAVERYGDSRYIIVLDLTDAQMRMLDFRIAQQSVEVDPRLQYTLIVGSPVLVDMALKVLGRIMTVQMRSADSVQDAVAEARRMLDHPNSG
jgi:hypothetical protein